MAPSNWTKSRSSDWYFRVGTGLSVSTLYFLIGYKFFPFQLPVLDSVVDRLVFTLRWQLFGLLTLFMAMAGVMSIREKHDSAANPMDPKGQQLTKLAQNILQNTLEQYLFHFVAQLIMCTYLTGESMKVIPLLIILFVVARIVFKIGYEKEPMVRAYGFSSTLPPTILTCGYCLYCFVTYGAGYGLGKQ
ncbi:transmembrane protein 79-like [Ylistrum balloti]|uniref:transmembrane protein 79-like n=1 Tax=Ylistrum balloti TaxID=509963 RepID=UPI002905C51F|nr:transmembrane protein 79-like [Ylistrum balloti]